MSVEPSEEYAYTAPRYGHGPPPGAGGRITPLGEVLPNPDTPRAMREGAFLPPSHYSGGQMVPYNFQNPFAPMNGNNGAEFFGGPPRGPYDMMPYGATHQGPNGFFPGQGGYGLSHHMQQFIYPNPPPPPPATEVGAP